MALPNTKNNFFARLLGNTSRDRDKSRYPQQEEPYQPQAQNEGNPEGSMEIFPTGDKSYYPQQDKSYRPQFQTRQPQVQQTPIAQPNQATTQPQPETTATQGNSRYRLMQMIDKKPEMDSDAVNTLQKRAKINAIGKGFSALAGLGGMAMGGDAPEIPDLVTPFNMNRMQFLDQDYRNRLQDWTNRNFQVEAKNNDILNRETDQQIDTENYIDRLKLQGENAKQLAAQKATDALNQLLTKSEVDQIKEMQKVGINPESENAYGQYLQKMSDKFNADLKYTKSRTSFNNRPIAPRSGSGSGTQFPYSLDTVKKGRDMKISELESQKQEALKSARLPSEKESISKSYDDAIDYYRKYNPGSNELMDLEMAQIGGDGFGEFDGSTPNTNPEKWDPEFYMENQPISNVKADETIRIGFQKITSPDWEKMSLVDRGNIINEIINNMLEAGYAETEEEAEQFLLQKINEGKNQ